MRMATWRRALAGPGLDHPWTALVDRDQSEWRLESIDELGTLVITQKQIVPWKGLWPESEVRKVCGRWARFWDQFSTRDLQSLVEERDFALQRELVAPGGSRHLWREMIQIEKEDGERREEDPIRVGARVACGAIAVGTATDCIAAWTLIDPDDMARVEDVRNGAPSPAEPLRRLALAVREKSDYEARCARAKKRLAASPPFVESLVERLVWCRTWADVFEGFTSRDREGTWRFPKRQRLSGPQGTGAPLSSSETSQPRGPTLDQTGQQGEEAHDDATAGKGESSSDPIVFNDEE